MLLYHPKKAGRDDEEENAYPDRRDGAGQQENDLDQDRGKMDLLAQGNWHRARNKRILDFGTFIMGRLYRCVRKNLKTFLKMRENV